MKLGYVKSVKSRLTSPPSRGAWIEISYILPLYVYPAVAPLAGGVD